MELSDQTENYAAAAAGPSRPRHNLAIPRAPRAPRTGIHAEVPIDLTLDESSDEDDMVVTGANVVAPGPPRPLIQRFPPPPMAEARRPRVNYDDDEFHDEFEGVSYGPWACSIADPTQPSIAQCTDMGGTLMLFSLLSRIEGASPLLLLHPRLRFDNE